MACSCSLRVSRAARCVIGALLAASAASAQSPAVAQPRARWDALAAEFLNADFAARPDAAVNAGRHEFDGRLPDWSDAGRAAYDSRDARFLSAIGLHTRGMTVAESERMFREEAYQPEAIARQQAARGTFDPQYLAYTMGKPMIRKLRDDWTATHGGRAAWKRFHDEFLSYGGPPIPIVGQLMMGRAGALF